MMNKFSPYFMAVLSAVLLTLASPGFNLWFLAYFALVPVLITASMHKKPALIMWFFGFLYFFFNLRWIETSVSFFGGAPAVVGYLAAGGFAALLAVFWALFGFVLGRKKGSNLLLAAIIVASEAIKAHLFTGFPWLNLSHTQYNFLPAIQTAELGGELFVTLMLAYFNIALADFFISRNKHSVTVASVLVAACFAYGFIALHRDIKHDIVKTRVIQPAYSQADKWNKLKQDDIFLLVSEMIRNSEPEKYDLLVLPETVYPAFLEEDFSGYLLMSVVSDITPVIAGGIRAEGSPENRKYHNSVFMFDKGRMSIYDKRHLVPFGEYFPMGKLFKPIDYYFFKGAEDFTPGSEASVFSSMNINAAPLVCYESAYSQLIAPQIEKGANMITVVTNDSWFGDTQGPAQHLAADVMRSVEFRRSVVRAAQSGISACIEPTGKIAASIGLNKNGYMDCAVKTTVVKTVFASAGYTWLPFFLLAAFIYDRRKKHK